MSDGTNKNQKFFTLIPAGTKIAFVERRWRYITISIVAVLLSLGVMVFNQINSGSILNFGIDFAGGSQVRLRFDADIVCTGIAGYQSDGVTRAPRAEHVITEREFRRVRS